jgi:diphthine-ammonia ligase
MKAASLFSGGKDSVFSSYLCHSWGWDLELLTLAPESDSMMFHHPNTKWCALQAKAAGLSHHSISVRNNSELADLEKELKRMKKSDGIEGIITGAIASEYQKQRIEIIGENISLPTFNPLWHKGEAVLREMAQTMEILVVSVSAEGLGKEWLGRRLDDGAIDELKSLASKPNIFFEGGEAETFVCDAPFFSRKIAVKKGKIHWDGVRGTYEIESAILA